MPVAESLFKQLNEALAGGEGDAIVKGLKDIVVFDIDGTKWTLDLRPGETKKVTKGDPPAKPAVTLTVADADFAKLVAGKASPQQLFMTRKLKIGGSMAMALKLTPILQAAGPRAKL